MTTIRKVSYESGKLTAGAQCKIDGYINDSFSIDEYDGYLQLENGVGMLRLLETEVKETLEGLSGDDRKVTGRIATGKLAAGGRAGKALSCRCAFYRNDAYWLWKTV